MKALVKAEAAPGLWLRDVPKPQIADDEVLIQVAKTAICGTDLHIFAWDAWAAQNVPVPMTVGHEYAGRIAAVGARVRHLAVGQRVTGEGHVVGFLSRNARAGRFHLDPQTKGVGVNRPGAFAEYLALPAFNVVPLPDDISDDIAACLDPLGNAVHTALAFDLVGEDVLITGAGPIGIMAAAVARKVGARHVVLTDVNPDRLALAAQVVPSVVTVDVTRQNLADLNGRLKMKEGFDVALEMSGSEAAFNQCVDALIMGGKMAMLGIPAGPIATDWGRIILKSLTIKTIYGREMFETWHKMLALLQSGLDISGLITHRFPADAFETAFATAASGKAGKVVMDWT